MEWKYFDAFSRNIGLLTESEQKLVSEIQISVVGCGGVGGIHLLTLARAGFRNFIIADPDSFEVVNFNRQFGATLSSLGKNKAEVLKQMILEINPEASIKILNDKVSPENINEFLSGSQILVDGIDAFEVHTRFLIFDEAYKRKMAVMTFAPFGFGTAWICFTPEGMSPKDYFGYYEGISFEEAFASFAAGVAPSFMHLKYMSRQKMDIAKKIGPSYGGSCALCAGVMSIEVLKYVIKRGERKYAPHYFHFDLFLMKFKSGYMFFGNKNPIYWLKRKLIPIFMKQKK